MIENGTAIKNNINNSKSNGNIVKQPVYAQKQIQLCKDTENYMTHTDALKYNFEVVSLFFFKYSRG